MPSPSVKMCSRGITLCVEKGSVICVTLCIQDTTQANNMVLRINQITAPNTHLHNNMHNLMVNNPLHNNMGQHNHHYMDNPHNLMDQRNLTDTDNNHMGNLHNMGLHSLLMVNHLNLTANPLLEVITNLHNNMDQCNPHRNNMGQHNHQISTGNHLNLTVNNPLHNNTD